MTGANPSPQHARGAEPDEQLIALVGAALRQFGRGIRCTLRVSGVSAVLIFPDDKPSTKPESPKC